ncbi:MAG: C10 family peptidase [Bacteroidetes bacterium]|nr:C10 family peptidase [Bacteroidota bacterium]MBL6944042.1 C10 family peptidase [Bacteroidales bacterium]
MKSKVLLSILVIFTVTASIFAKDISLSKAEQVAVNFFFQKSNQYGDAINYYDLNISETYLVDQSYYVINFENGWVVVSANDVMTPVLGYNFSKSFPEIDDQIDNFKSWMQTYVDQVNFIRENDIEAAVDVIEAWNTYTTNDPSVFNLRGDRDIDPLLTNMWNQDNPYNAMCPVDAAGPGGHVYVGCVATAMSMIMHYWRYPLQGTGSHSYYIYPYGTQSANFGEADYDWNGMTDVINNKFIWEIAEISFHSAVSVDMAFSPDGSGAYSNDVPYALINYFNYQSAVQYLSKNSYPTSTWENMMQTELNNFRPIYYSGRNTDNGGHAFVCDGYQGTNYYHFNFGWSGSGNGFYSLQDINGFYLQQGMVRNIYPGDASYPYIVTGQTDLGNLVGSFTDGSGPAEDYPIGMDASWLISPQNEIDSVTSITLSFIEFNTASSDMFRIYDGGDESAELLGEFSGNNLPSNISSSGNQLYITFSSTGTGEGFKLEYVAQIPTWCSSEVFSEPAGTITDGSFDFYYNNATNCVFTLTHPEAVRYTLDFTAMATEEDLDNIRVYNGATGSLVGEFSGHTLPDPIVIDANAVLLMWSTNSTIRDEGWSVDYNVDGVGFEETIVENLSIFPNPTTGLLNINFNAEKQRNINIKLISITGQVILDEEMNSVSGQYNNNFDISNNAKGIYLLSITTDNKKIDSKIVLK